MSNDLQPLNIEEEVLAVARRWDAAFAASDIETVLALFAPSAIFIGTLSPGATTRPADLRDYFELALRGRARAARTEDPRIRAIGADAAIVTGTSITGELKDGAWIEGRGRLTLVFERHPEGWRIVHFHRSAMPA